MRYAANGQFAKSVSVKSDGLKIEQQIKITMKKFFWLFLIPLFIASCQHQHDANDGHTHDETGKSNDSSVQVPHTHNENEVILTKSQLEVYKIKLGELPRKITAQEIRATGTLHLPPQNRALVGSVISGKITQIYVHEGETVKKGQLLAKITDPKIILLQKEYLISREDLKLKRAEAERQKQLKAGDATSDKNLLAAQSAFVSAAAQNESLAAELRLLGINAENLTPESIVSEIGITAPVSGSLFGIFCNLREFILPEKAVFEIYNLEHLHLEILVYEKDISAVKIGQKVLFSPLNQKSLQSEAKVYAVAQGVDAATKTVRVHAETTGKSDGLLPGMFCNVFIESSAREADFLPEEAILKEGEEHYAFRLKSKNADEYIFEKIKLHLQAVQDGFVLLDYTGSRADFVLDGAFYMNKSSEEEGHSH